MTNKKPQKSDNRDQILLFNAAKQLGFPQGQPVPVSKNHIIYFRKGYLFAASLALTYGQPKDAK